ncbi:MAG: NarK/NasA family nitrate transporter [Chloroflexi bacterium]|nr:NarK/NasA family nitrate transporter [Chloroflexota bacterium]
MALALATLSFIVGFAAWGLLAPLAPLFRKELGLSATQTGILVAVPVILGSIARIPLGLLTDRFGGRIVFTVFLFFLAIPLVLAGLTVGFATLLAVAFILGVAGAVFAIGVPFVVRWFPPAKQGMALGIYGTGNIGTAIAALIAPTVAEELDWPFAFWIFVPVVLVMGALVLLFARDAPGARPARSLTQQFSPLKRPTAWVLSLFYFLTFGGFVAISVYLPTFLVDAFELQRGDAAARTAGFVILATLMRPVGGTLADRWGGAPVLNGTFIVVALLPIVLAFHPGILIMTIMFLGMAAALGLGNGAVFKLVAESFPRETGAVTGLVGAAGGLGGFFPPILMGLVLDATGAYSIGFMLLSEIALGCLIVNLLVMERHATVLMPSR